MRPGGQPTGRKAISSGSIPPPADPPDTPTMRVIGESLPSRFEVAEQPVQGSLGLSPAPLEEFDDLDNKIWDVFPPDPPP